MTDDTIEALLASDIEVVARLHARCFYDAWGPSMIRQVLDIPSAYGLVARRGGYGSIIGFALARVTAEECELLSLGVAAEHRARGVGTLLLTATMARAMADRARWFFLEVAEDNESALKLYRTHGMNRVGQRLDYYENADGSRTNALTMRCALPLVPVGGN
ncbi:MAG: GNAT family N-acetyltransferase [Alphaproteobacteria bacterium]